MLQICVLTILELNCNQRLEHKQTKLNICHHILTSSTQLQNRSFHVVERTRTSSKCQKMKNARAKRAKILFFIVRYANLWGFCCRRRRGCLSSLLLCVDVVAITLNLEISCCHLANYIKHLYLSACRTCSTTIFSPSTNRIIVFWRSRFCCRRPRLSSLIVHVRHAFCCSFFT